MKFKIRALAHNPLVIIPPLVLVMAIGWQQYTFAGRNLNFPQGPNLMPQGYFSQFDDHGIPAGWQLSSTGSLKFTSSRVGGYTGDEALRVDIAGYKSGNTNLSSPKVNITTGKSFLFKGYYNASSPFTLLARTYHADGTSTLSQVQPYQPLGKNWSTVSDAFIATKNDTAIQFIFHLYGNGELTLDSLYVEARPNVYIKPAISGANTIPNSQLTAGDNNAPDGWSTYHAGNNTADLSYLQDSAGPYMQTQITSYHSGEAKWQYQPQPVQGNQYYQFRVSYQSGTNVQAVAEYELQGGKRQYQVIATLPPTDEWTTVTYYLETPAEATNLFVSLPLQHSGFVSTRDYQLINITKPPVTHWPGPIVSLTFDGGLESQYENARPLLQHYGYKATYYINPSTIETRGFMTAANLTGLAGSGDEIGARGYNPDDMTAINQSALDNQLHSGRDYLRDAGFKVNDFAVPYGHSDAEVQYYARKYYATLRGTESGINTWQNLDPYNLKVLNVSSSTSQQTFLAALEAVKAEGGWLILAYQGVGHTGNDSSADSQANVSLDAFQQQISQINKSGLHVAPVNAVYGAIHS